MIFIFAPLMSISIADTTPFAYITKEGSDTVSVIHTATDTIIDTILMLEMVLWELQSIQMEKKYM